MKKYGDDADSFHDQGTRIEASERGYEQNQLRNDYAYRSVSKSNYRSYNKKDNKSRNINKTPYTHYTQFNDSNFKPNWSCAPDYDENYYERNNRYNFTVPDDFFAELLKSKVCFCCTFNSKFNRFFVFSKT